MAIPYPGRRASNVNKDAKYSIVSGSDGRMEVRLVYRVSSRERQLLTSDRHDDLVDMVNAVKLEVTGQRGGAFYINEFFDVLVPDFDRGCFFAGTYERLLEFDYEGSVIGPRPPSQLRPGDLWPGPHVGINYTLAAGGDDIKYQLQIPPRGLIEHRLSDYHGGRAAAQLAHRLRGVKGYSGGRVYINEVGEFFAPRGDPHGEVSYFYLGSLGDDQWFPPPDVDRTT